MLLNQLIDFQQSVADEDRFTADQSQQLSRFKGLRS